MYTYKLQDLKTIAALDILLDENPSSLDRATDSLKELAEEIDKCPNNYHQIASLIDIWLTKHSEIESEFLEIFNRLNNSSELESSKFFPGVNRQPQDPESIHEEKIRQLTNKMRIRNLSNPNPSQPDEPNQQSTAS